MKIQSFKKPLVIIGIILMVGYISIGIVNSQKSIDFKQGLDSSSSNATIYTTFYPEPLSDLSKASCDSTPYLDFLCPESPYYGKYHIPDRGNDLKSVINHTASGINKNSIQSGITDAAYGTFIDYNINGIIGTYAGHQVQPDISFSDAGVSQVLYAPTLLPPNYCPLETTTTYYRVNQWNPMEKSLGVWDHTVYPQPECVYRKVIDSTFLSNYVREYPEGKLYFTETYKSGNNWIVYLFNFNTGTWESIYTKNGDGPRSHGWDVWECHMNGVQPPTLPKIECVQLKIYKDGTWQYVTSTYGLTQNGGADSYYSCTMKYNYYDWYVQS